MIRLLLWGLFGWVAMRVVQENFGTRPGLPVPMSDKRNLPAKERTAIPTGSVSTR